jgi:hypothetical protein
LWPGENAQVRVCFHRFFLKRLKGCESVEVIQMPHFSLLASDSHGSLAVPGHQMKRYYVFGDVDPCTNEFQTLKLAFWTRLMKRETGVVGCTWFFAHRSSLSNGCHAPAKGT